MLQDFQFARSRALAAGVDAERSGSRLQQTQSQREGTNSNMRGFGSTVLEARDK
jgi:hypothetical protein